MSNQKLLDSLYSIDSILESGNIASAKKHIKAKIDALEKLRCEKCGTLDEEHSNQCNSCFEFVNHKNLKNGLCHYCNMRNDDPDSYAEAKYFGYTRDSPDHDFSDSLMDDEYESYRDYPIEEEEEDFEDFYEEDLEND